MNSYRPGGGPSAAERSAAVFGSDRPHLVPLATRIFLGLSFLVTWFVGEDGFQPLSFANITQRHELHALLTGCYTHGGFWQLLVFIAAAGPRLRKLEFESGSWGALVWWTYSSLGLMILHLLGSLLLAVPFGDRMLESQMHGAWPILAALYCRDTRLDFNEILFFIFGVPVNVGLMPAVIFFLAWVVTGTFPLDVALAITIGLAAGQYLDMNDQFYEVIENGEFFATVRDFMSGFASFVGRRNAGFRKILPTHHVPGGPSGPNSGFDGANGSPRHAQAARAAAAAVAGGQYDPSYPSSSKGAAASHDDLFVHDAHLLGFTSQGGPEVAARETVVAQPELDEFPEPSYSQAPAYRDLGRPNGGLPRRAGFGGGSSQQGGATSSSSRPLTAPVDTADWTKASSSFPAPQAPAPAMAGERVAHGTSMGAFAAPQHRQQPAPGNGTAGAAGTAGSADVFGQIPPPGAMPYVDLPSAQVAAQAPTSRDPFDFDL